LSASFVAAPRLAVVFLAPAFLAPADPPMTASLKALRGVMRAFLEALMWMASPVAGWRPMRAARSTLANLANPLIATCSPRATVDVTTSVNPLRTLSTSFASASTCDATALMSSRRFNVPPFGGLSGLALHLKGQVLARQDTGAPNHQGCEGAGGAPASSKMTASG